MKIQLLYFASLAEALGCAQEQIELSTDDNQVAKLKDILSQRGDGWMRLINDKSTRCAVNQTLANDETLIEDGAEVAFFPPVTGG